MNIADLFRRQAAARPGGEAFRCGDDVLTWSEIDTRTDAVGAHLSDSLAIGARVCIVGLNCHRYWEMHVACAKAGLVSVPINHRLTSEEISHILADVGVAAIALDSRVPAAADAAKQFPGVLQIDLTGDAVGGRAYETIASQVVAQKPDRRHDINAVGFTSGTTGRARGAILSQHTATSSALWFCSLFGLSTRSTFLACMPAYVYRGQGAAMAPAILGSRTVPLIFDAAAVLEAIEKHRVTHVILAPPMVDRLLGHPELASRDLSSLESIWIGGAPSSPEAVRRLFERVGCDIGSTYGMTEATGIASTRWSLGTGSDEDRDLLSVGRPGQLLDVRLLGSEGQVVRPGEIGEVVVRGDSMMLGYWGSPPEACFTEGWFHTGDMATQEPDGRMFLVDRRADVIVSGGLNVYANEVELAINSHPAVMSCAVVSAPDDDWGETVVAVVVIGEGESLSPEEMSEHCRPLLARYKHPRRLVVVDELPTNALGKTDKKALREPFWAGRERRIG